MVISRLFVEGEVSLREKGTLGVGLGLGLGPRLACPFPGATPPPPQTNEKSPY